MFREKLASLFMRNMAIDLGTINTLIAIKGRGIVLREPSAVAVSLGPKREILAVGNEAIRMLGRTPGGINIIYPMRDGVVADATLAEAMLRHYIIKALGKRPGIFGIRLVMCLPMCVTSVEKRALAEAAHGAGARNIMMIDEPLAAAIGARLPVFEPVGSMIVDIGGGTSDAAVIAFGGTAAAKSIRTGGTHIDEAILEYIASHYGVSIGARTAEEIKFTIGSATVMPSERMAVRGRNISTGLPASIVVDSSEITRAIAPVVRRIMAAATDTLAATPPELAGDLVGSGIVLTGGGALLKGLDRLLANETGMPVTVDESPLDSVVAGALAILDEPSAFSEPALGYGAEINIM